jgi:hypothetical protein
MQVVADTPGTQWFEVLAVRHLGAAIMFLTAVKIRKIGASFAVMHRW